jgi:hypothetical protein
MLRRPKRSKNEAVAPNKEEEKYKPRFDMDMSYARMVRTASLTSYPVRCKILHQRTPSLS